MSIEVIINEGQGTRLWRWFPKMTEDEFVSWWQNMRDREFIKYYFNIKALEGKMTPYKAPHDEKTDKQRMIGDPSDFTPFYYCHFNEMDDSFIAIGSERIFYTPTSRRDWRDFWPDWSNRKFKQKVNMP